MNRRNFKKMNFNVLEMTINERRIHPNLFFVFIDETQFMRLGGKLKFGNISIQEKNPVIFLRHLWLIVLIMYWFRKK